MDLLLGGFARAYVPQLDAAGLDDFEALLDMEDPELYAWYCKQAVPPANLNNPALDAFLAYEYGIA
jgi:antitoxin CptB